MFIRQRLKPGSWQIQACVDVSTWSMKKEIVFMIRFEKNVGDFYERELNWCRRFGSSRRYLQNYPSDLKMREFPGRGHMWVRFLKESVKQPYKHHPMSQAAAAELDERTQRLMEERLRAGFKAWLAILEKHIAWIYQSFGLVLQINSPGLSGYIARALVRDFHEDILAGEDSNSLKDRALRAIEASKSSEEDVFWHALVVADRDNVRHFAYQFHLFHGNEEEFHALAFEWVRLCENPSMDPASDPLIHDSFADEFRILHARQQLYVDPLMTDTLSREAEFSMQRYYNNGLMKVQPL